MKKYILSGLVFLLLACTVSGPQKALNNIATALEDNNPQVFLEQFDMQAYASNSIRNITGGSDIANAISSFTQSLGLGNLDSLLGSVVDMKARLTDQFTMGVSSGEMMADCRTSTTPDCPWVPDSLRGAQIVEIAGDAAIAKITTPARITSWIALHKYGEKWLVVGQAVLEKDARNYAMAGKTSQPAKPSVGDSRTPDRNAVKI